MAYTPFMKEGAKSLRGALQGRRERGIETAKNETAQRAYMGDPMAVQELAGLDPELAMQVEDQASARKATTQQENLAKDTAFQKESKTILEQIGSFNTYAEAQEFGGRMKGYLAEKYPERTAAKGEGAEFTEQNFKNIKAITDKDKADKMSTIGSGYQVKHPKTGEPATAILRDDGAGNVYEELMEGPAGTSLTRLSQYDADLKRSLAMAQAGGAKQGGSEEERAQIAIDAGTAAAVIIPDLNRSMDLIDKLVAADPTTAATAGWKQDLMAMQQYVGYEGEAGEVADLAELQQLLGTQMFDTLSNFKGAISATELSTAKQLSTGLGKNPEANKRILNQLKQRMVRAVTLAKRAATQRGDVIALEMLEAFDPYAASEYTRAGGEAGGGGEVEPPPASTAPPAPQAALDYLKANPAEIQKFFDQFGYKPEGF